MSNKLSEKFFDVRVLQRNLKKGLITTKDIQDFNKSLPNDEDNFELTMVETDEIGISAKGSENNVDNSQFLESNKIAL